MIGGPYAPEAVSLLYILYPAKSLSVLGVHVNVTDEVAGALTVSVTATVFEVMSCCADCERASICPSAESCRIDACR